MGSVSDTDWPFDFREEGLSEASAANNFALGEPGTSESQAVPAGQSLEAAVARGVGPAKSTSGAPAKTARGDLFSVPICSLSPVTLRSLTLCDIRTCVFCPVFPK